MNKEDFWAERVKYLEEELQGLMKENIELRHRLAEHPLPLYGRKYYFSLPGDIGLLKVIGLQN